MQFLLLRSLKLFLHAYLEACCFNSKKQRPFSLNRVLFLVFIFPAFAVLQLIHCLGFLLDHLLYRKFKQQSCDKALFVIGIPRSGTTYIHRTLSKSMACTTFSTWEAILAPSIFQKKCLRLLSKLDGCLGSPFQKTLNFSIKKIGGNFHDIHSVSMNEPEEDYLTLLPIGACFILLFAFPNSQGLRKLTSLDNFTQEERTAIIGFYKENIQRHLYFHGLDTCFLSKNAAFSTWLPEIKKAFPKAKFLLSIREPKSALSSQLSSLKPARSVFGTDPSGATTQKIILESMEYAFQSIYSFTQNTDPKQRVIIDQQRLLHQPHSTLNEAMELLDLDIQSLGTSEEPLPIHTKSKHQHDNFAVNNDIIAGSVFENYQLILKDSIGS